MPFAHFSMFRILKHKAFLKSSGVDVWLVFFPYEAEMSGLSYFVIQIQSCFVKTLSKSKHCPKHFSNINSKSKLSPKIF